MIIQEKLPKIEEEISGVLKETCLSFLKEGKPIYVTAKGMSMYPFLKSADRLKIALVREGKIRLGDIIAVDRRNGSAWFTVHRVVKISGDKRYYFTKGDFHKEGMDGPVTAAEIAGKIVWFQRRNLEIDLEQGVWKYINRMIAKLSLSFSRILVFLAPYISLIIEWKLFWSKVNNWLVKGDPVQYNTEELILICARKDLNDELIKKSEVLITEGVDWERFCHLTMKSGVVALIYNSLVRISGHTYISEQVIDKLRAISNFIILKSVFQERELVKILELFTAQDIPVIPLKGIALAKRLYGDIAARGLSGDFDFLIREADKEKAYSLLRKINYTLMLDKEAERYECQYVFAKLKGTIIDLHLDITLTGRSPERITGFWQGARMVTDGRVNYYEFKEEELLLYLCTHLVCSDCCRNLRSLSDINQLLYNHHLVINWDSIIKKAKQWRLSSSLYVALSMCKKLFNSPILNEILNKIKPSLLKRALIGIFTNKKFILQNCKRKEIMSSYLGFVFFELVEAKTFFQYFSIIFRRILFPPKDVLLSNKNYKLRPVFVGYTLRLFWGLVNLCSIVKDEK